MTLEKAAMPYQPPTSTLTLHQVNGRVLTTSQLVALALAERKAGREAVAYDLLDQAGVTRKVLAQ